MKNLYLYLLCSGLVIAGMLSRPDTTEIKEYQLKNNPETLGSSRKVTLPPKQRAAYEPRWGVGAPTRVLLAPLITATNVYALTQDQGLPGTSAGDELEYTVTISNGGTAATGVTFEDLLDPNTTLVPNSIVAEPLAVNDNYNTIGNVGMDIPASQGLLNNDVSPAGTPLVISTASPITTLQGGIVDLNVTTGAFTYVAPAGYNGSDSFTYSIGNGSGITSTATATISISGRIWFVNSSSSVGSEDGTIQKPFKTIAALQAINTGATLKGQNNDYIYIYTGTDKYESNLTLRTGQKLIGQGTQDPILTITRYRIPSGTNILPGVGGDSPVLTATTAATNAVTLATENMIRGLNIGATTGSKIKGNDYGKLEAKEVKLTGVGGALQLTNGVLEAEFPLVSVETTGVPAIQITTTRGNLTISAGSLTTTSASAVVLSGKSSEQKLNLNLQFTSVSASNALKGMELVNTSGSFTVSGTGVAGSGGVISSIKQRGADLRDASRVTLKYMNFLNANTVEGIAVINGDNTNCNAAIHAIHVRGLTLENISVSDTTLQQGINLNGVSDFKLTNSTLVNCGSGTTQEEGGIYAVNTTGTSTIEGSILSKPSGRAAYFKNTGTDSLRLNVENSDFLDAYNAEGFLFEGLGTSKMDLKITNSRFLRNQTSGLAVYANDNSEVSVDMLGSTVDPTNAALSPDDIGLGIDISGSGSAKVNFNVINNDIKARGGNVVNVFLAQDGFGEGTFEDNRITSIGGSGAGIRVRTEGMASSGSNLAHAVVRMVNNNIGGVTADSGIKVESNSLNAGRIDVIIINNEIKLNPADINTSFYNVDINAPNFIDNTGKICAMVFNNTIPEGTQGEEGVARFRAGAWGTQILFQGTGLTPQNVWSGNFNTAGPVISEPRLGTLTYGVFCAVPANPMLRVMNQEVAESLERQSTSMPVTANLGGGVETESKSKQIEKPAEKPVKNTAVQSVARMTAAQAGETILVNGGGSGFAIPANTSIVIKFKVTINSSIPDGTCTVTNQGTVRGNDFTDVLTDDPSVAGASNATETQVVSTPVFTTIPANITRDLVGDNCLSSETPTAVAASCPAPTTTYSIGEVPITFPYDFPEGVTTVNIVASNEFGSSPASSFTVTVNCTPLPVTLIDFSGKNENNTAVLNWKTTAETNSDRFQVERSSDGKRWETLGTVKAKGESNIEIPYRYVDLNPDLSRGENLYRLKMIDQDATFTYSRIISLRFEGGQPMVLYPNPVSDDLRIKALDLSAISTVEIVDIRGATVFKSGRVLSDRVNVRDLKAGSYVIRIQEKNGNKVSYRFVIAR